MEDFYRRDDNVLNSKKPKEICYHERVLLENTDGELAWIVVCI